MVFDGCGPERLPVTAAKKLALRNDTSILTLWFNHDSRRRQEDSGWLISDENSRALLTYVLKFSQQREEIQVGSLITHDAAS
jgi:hypothetical protein